jgi:dihydroorotase
MAAATGGFTEVMLLPNTIPVIQSKNGVSYLISKNGSNLTQIHPSAAVTIDTKGEELTEMIDLQNSGAVAFTDGEKPIWQTDILLKSLQYLQKFDGLLIQKPEDKRLNLFGTMNEGVNSTTLGMKGMPKLSEEIIVARDLGILEYTGGSLHFSNISSAKSVDLIKKAKQKGLKVTCDIAAYQPVFDDSIIEDYDTNYKVNPPFREQNDNKALLKGLKDGTIDVIVSGHCPQDEESKKLEFDLAEFGIIGMQTAFSNIVEFSQHIDLETLIEKITVNPRQILGLEIPQIKEGSTANLTVFDPKVSWTFTERNNQSKSLNSPFLNQNLKGKAMAVFNNGKHLIDPDLEEK